MQIVQRVPHHDSCNECLTTVRIDPHQCTICIDANRATWSAFGGASALLRVVAIVVVNVWSRCKCGCKCVCIAESRCKCVQGVPSEAPAHLVLLLLRLLHLRLVREPLLRQLQVCWCSCSMMVWAYSKGLSFKLKGSELQTQRV